VHTPGTLPGHASAAEQSLLEMPGNDLEAMVSMVICAALDRSCHSSQRLPRSSITCTVSSAVANGVSKTGAR
jgi:hypothetical protein